MHISCRKPLEYFELTEFPDGVFYTNARCRPQSGRSRAASQPLLREMLGAQRKSTLEAQRVLVIGLQAEFKTNHEACALCLAVADRADAAKLIAGQVGLGAGR